MELGIKLQLSILYLHAFAEPVSMKLLLFGGWHICASHLKLFDMFFLIFQLLVEPFEHMIDYC